MTGLAGLSAGALLEGYRERRFSPVEVVEALAARIEAVDPSLGAFTTLCLERALGRGPSRRAALGARRARRAARGGSVRRQGPVRLGGRPDDVRLADVRRPRAGRDAEAVRRARAAGAILVGKTQTHEFAWGITSVNVLMGSSSNPWALERMSGGSSGGSAVALAAQLVPLALGSDTGGSIRVPSGFCGIVGLKPTYGRVSAAGVWPLARSLDHPGPMARTPADAALLLQAIAGVDAGDPATEDVPLGDAGRRARGGPGGRARRALPRSAARPARRRTSAPSSTPPWPRVERLGGELVEVELARSRADLRDVRHDPARRGARHARAAPASSRPGGTSTARTCWAGSSGDEGRRSPTTSPPRPSGSGSGPRFDRALRPCDVLLTPVERRLAASDRGGDGRCTAARRSSSASW